MAIGKTEAAYPLDVSGNVRFTGSLAVNGNQITIGGTSAQATLNLQYGGANYIRCGTSGGYLIFVVNGATVSLANSSWVIQSGGCYSNGYVSAKGQNASSDERLKADFRPLNLSLAEIANAPSIAFKWKNDGSRDFGSIAQYWQKVNPLFTRRNPLGYLTLDYGKIALASVISLAKASVSHEERIAALERENRELRKRVAELERA